MRVALVLRQGGGYGPKHVYTIRRMLNEFLPDAEVFCLSDTASLGPLRIPLKYDWPKWWAKMELFRPDIEGDLLFLDLDTVIVGDLAPMIRDASSSIVLRDVYRLGEAVQSSIMLLREEDRAFVWNHWSTRPAEEWMRSVHSDQIVIEEALKGRVKFWQDTHPGACVSFKADLGKGTRPVPEDARVVVFHGRPRPWDCGQPWAEEWWRWAS